MSAQTIVANVTIEGFSIDRRPCVRVNFASGVLDTDGAGDDQQLIHLEPVRIVSEAAEATIELLEAHWNHRLIGKIVCDLLRADRTPYGTLTLWDSLVLRAEFESGDFARFPRGEWIGLEYIELRPAAMEAKIGSKSVILRRGGQGT